MALVVLGIHEVSLDRHAEDYASVQLESSWANAYGV